MTQYKRERGALGRDQGGNDESKLKRRRKDIWKNKRLTGIKRCNKNQRLEKMGEKK